MKPSPSLNPSRRQFLGGVFATAAASSLRWVPDLGAAETPASGPSGNTSAAPATYSRKIKLGVIGNGGRGAWIAKLFQAHGGYDMWAVADYFSDVAEKYGAELGVDPSRRFSTLSGYKKLIESGVEAVAIETPPYFIPEHVSAAVDAGLHVYMAKPVAADVPGALKVEAAGRRATEARRCFLVDYQMPTDPVNLEVAARIRNGALGRLARIVTTGQTELQQDPPKTDTIESRLQHLIWVNDVALSCDYLGNFDIHAIDAALWILGQRPVVASGASYTRRPNPHGDARDVVALVFEYADGLIHHHAGQALNNKSPLELSAAIYGTEAHAVVNYWGKSYIRGGGQHYGGGTIDDLYAAGAQRNIARFYDEATSGNLTNDTCQRAVDGVLTCVLGYEAAARRERLTMDTVIRENKRLEVDLRGLKT